jgi:A/G-specific adenine glycosylase
MMEPTPESLLHLRRALLAWYDPAARPLPWKAESDPYLIWLSEIILQQTRVAQGLPYFEKFKNAYPRIVDLAAASEPEVLKHWEGLGYYSRARNMLAAARYVATELDGRFPDTYEGIRRLKGVGPYTAAAIASFAYGLPHAVLDGNVFRVLARYLGDATPIDTTAGKRHFGALAEAALDPADPAIYNQAIMDFGATVCTPRRPACGTCPLRADCRARREERIEELPLKAKKIKRRDRHFNYLVIEQGRATWLRRRPAGDIWQGLYEFPLLESAGPVRTPRELRALTDWPEPLTDSPVVIRSAGPPRAQQLTHQRIIARFWRLEVTADLSLPADYLRADRENLAKFAFPKIINWYLEDKSLYLNLE